MVGLKALGATIIVFLLLTAFFFFMFVLVKAIGVLGLLILPGGILFVATFIQFYGMFDQ